MENKKYWLTSGMYTMLHRGIDFLLGFIGFIFLVRIFSPESFGVWVLFITLLGIVDMARSGFVQNGMIKFLVNRSATDQAEIQMASLWLNAILTVIFMGILWSLAGFLAHILNAPGLDEVIKIYTFVLPLLILHTHNLVLMQAKYDFKAYFLAGISKSLPLFLIIMYYYLYRNGELTLPTLAWYQNATFLLATLMSCFQVRKYIRVRWGWHKHWSLRIFHFGKFVFGTNLVSMLTNSLDKFLLGALLSPVQVALANTAGRVMNMLEIPVNSIASISYPKATEAYDKQDLEEVGKIYEKTVGMMLSITLPFLLLNLLFAKYIVLLIAGDSYLEAVPFLQVVAFLAVIRPFDRQSGVFLDAIGKPFFNMIMVFGTFIYGALFTYMLIKGVGLLGAAYGLVIAVGLTAGIKQVILKKFIPIRPERAFRYALAYYPEIYRAGRQMLFKKG